MNGAIVVIEGGVTTPAGFKATGAHIGLRKKRKDLALLVSDVHCDFAAVFTTNAVKGAPILWNQEVVAKGGKVKALVVNSANANSGTGLPGLMHAKEMAETTANCFGIDPHEVLVSSTGLIGVYLPIDLVKAGIKSTAPQISKGIENGNYAAEAITTTDSFIKQMAVQFKIGDKTITIGAMAKGSSMVHPNMATTLGFLTTDVVIDPALLKKALSESIVNTFNMISVDGDTSTNDMVLLLSNGLAGNAAIIDEGTDYQLFATAVNLVLTSLARMIAKDGEGATKLVEINVSGAPTVEEARKMARSIVSSNLVKTAMFAEDANWGRIVAAMGSSGVAFDYDKLDLAMSSAVDEVPLLMEGMPYWTDEDLAKEVLQADEIHISIDLNIGDCNATAWGCDFTYEYIRKNGNYRAMQKAAPAEPLCYAAEGVA